MRMVDILSRCKSVAAAALLLGLVVAGSAQAVLFLGREARLRPFAFRWQALAADREQRYRFTLGRDYELYRALRQRLAPESILAVHFATFAAYSTRTRLEPLLHPLPVIDAGDYAAASASRPGADLYLLDLRPASPASLPPGFEQVAASVGDASGPPFVLWKLRRPDHPPSDEFGAPACAAARRRG